MLKIENGVPVPQPAGLTFTLSIMMVGESVHVPYGTTKNGITAAASRVRKKPNGAGKRFTMRSEGTGFRVWRIA